MSGSYAPIYRPVVLQTSSAGLSMVERVKHAFLIYLPADACSKCEQIDSCVRRNDQYLPEIAACRPSTP